MEKIFGNGGEWVNFKLAAAASSSKCLRGVVSTRYSSSSLSYRLAIVSIRYRIASLPVRLTTCSTRYRIASRLYTHHAHAHRTLHALARIALEAHASASFFWLPVHHDTLTCDLFRYCSANITKLSCCHWRLHRVNRHGILSLLEPTKGIEHGEINLLGCTMQKRQ